MVLSRLRNRIFGWLGRPLRSEHSAESRHRGPLAHVIILDGTMSTLEPGHETHAGRLYQMCREMGAEVSVFYEAGGQWTGWASAPDVMMGRGILSTPCLAETLSGQAAAMSHADAWQRLLPMLETYHRQVIDKVSERHVHGRIKQWLNMLQWYFPQAQTLFAEIRCERDPLVILQHIIQQQMLMA